MGTFSKEKKVFAEKLSHFANNLSQHISQDDVWAIKGFIDIFQNIYAISTDTKIISKVLEIH